MNCCCPKCKASVTVAGLAVLIDVSSFGRLPMFNLQNGAKRGVAGDLENPKTSYFWITKWVISLMLEIPLYGTDFEVCMLGGDRYKWTEISQMDIRCNRQHQAGWGFAKKTWATSQESQCPKKMGVCLGQTVLQRLCKQDLTFQATLEHIADHPLKAACCEHKLLLAFCGKSCRLWCLSSQAFSNIQQLSHLPCSLMAKLKSPLSAFTSQIASVFRNS